MVLIVPFKQQAKRDIQEELNILLQKGFARIYLRASGASNATAASSILRIEDAIMEALSQTPPELAADIYNTGIYLAGGGSMLRGLDKRISLKTDLPVYIAEDPLQAVVRGTGIVLKNIERYKTILIK